MTFHPGIPAEYMDAIVTGDARILAQAIPDESIDLIFTDPPYPKEFLPLYDWLARESMRVLKPGGFVLAMCGGMYLNQIYRMFDDAGLDYFYELNIISTGDAPYIWPRKAIAKVKPILVYAKGKARPRLNFINGYDGSRMGKKYHHWGQDAEAARYYIDCFSAPGDVVLEPFAGGGTTPVACALIGRRYIAFEMDAAAATTARNRIAAGDILHQGALFVPQAEQGELL